MAGAWNFKAWLESIGEQFTSFSDNQRNEILDHLIDISDPTQLYHLSEKLDRLLKRDFIVQLPKEIAFYLLTFLDPETLTVCCKVSTRWNEVVSSCGEVWKSACRTVGAFVPEGMEVSHYKELYQSTNRRVKGLREANAFDSLLLYGHSDRIMAVYYRSGKLATGNFKLCMYFINLTTGNLFSDEMHVNQS